MIKTVIVVVIHNYPNGKEEREIKLLHYDSNIYTSGECFFNEHGPSLIKEIRKGSADVKDAIITLASDSVDLTAGSGCIVDRALKQLGIKGAKIERPSTINISHQ